MAVNKFSSNQMFEYNQREKIIAALITGAVLGSIAIFIVYYAFSLRHADFFLIHIINSFIDHIKTTISRRGLLGAFYTALFGGFFFVPLPMESTFPLLLKNNSPFLIVLLFMAGFLISFSINYQVGKKLNNFAKKAISEKKFYKIKTTINKYGALAVFAFNAIPFLPSQPVSVILGVFRYNKTKFYIWFLLGQFLKYSVIAIIFSMF